MDASELAETLREGFGKVLEDRPIDEFIALTLTVPEEIEATQSEASTLAYGIALTRQEMETAELHLKAMLRQATIDAWALHGDAKPAPYRDALIEKEVDSSFAVVDARKKVAELKLEIASLEDSIGQMQAMRSKLRGNLYAANRLLDTLRALADPAIFGEVTLLSEGDENE